MQGRRSVPLAESARPTFSTRAIRIRTFRAAAWMTRRPLLFLGRITIPGETVHELLRLSGPKRKLIEFFPAHPHEGGVGAPEGEKDVRVIAMGRSTMTNRFFNLIVAFEGGQDRKGNRLGRALAHS